MSHHRSRRHLLKLSGCAIVALSGCSGVVSRPDDEVEPTPERDRSTPVETTKTAEFAESAGDTGAIDLDGSVDGTTATPGDPPTEVQQSQGGTETPPTSLDIDPPDTSFASVPLPESPGDYEYATMGRSGASVTATVFGNWKCPYTRGFVVNRFDEVVDRYVRPGDLAVQFRALAFRSGEPFLGPDAPRAAAAGLGVWHEDPDAYWSYFGYVFGNQPPEREDWATTEHLLAFAGAAGVDDPDRVRRAIEGEAYDTAVRANTALASDLGVYTVPRVEVNGEVSAPTVDFEATLAQLDRAVRR